jgi:hypothetical protein
MPSIAYLLDLAFTILGTLLWWGSQGVAQHLVKKEGNDGARAGAVYIKRAHRCDAQLGRVEGGEHGFTVARASLSTLHNKIAER